MQSAAPKATHAKFITASYIQGFNRIKEFY